MRVGVVYPGGPTAPTAWSGVPAGFMGGLREAGVEPVPLDPSPGRAAELVLKLALAPRYPPDTLRDPGRSLLFSETGAELVRLRSRTLLHRLKPAAPLDALLVMGGLVLPPRGMTVVTYDDVTIPLGLRYGYPHWRALRGSALRARALLTAELYRRAVACCTTTRWAADSMVSDVGVPAAKVQAIGIGRGHEPLAADRDWSSPRFLFVGRDWQRKGGPLALAAFRRVREARPDATLDVVGEHPPLAEPGVTGHGPLQAEALGALFASATCFLMIARVDAGGIAYTEAGAAGIPSIGSSVGAPAEMIGRGGKVVHPDDETGLVEAMLELAEPDSARRLGELAREHAQYFTWRGTAERLLQALDSRTRR